VQAEADLRRRASEGAARAEFLRYQIEEIERLDPQPGELATLRARITLLRDAHHVDPPNSDLIERDRASIAALIDAVASIDGATTKAGSGVLEAFARRADKGTALMELGVRLGTATSIFVGDDITDEEAFGRLGPDDVAIKVGDSITIAPHRLRNPDAVLEFLRSLANH